VADASLKNGYAGDFLGFHIYISNNLPTITIAGGKQGSHIINLSVEPILKTLLKEFNVIHQAGDMLDYKDYMSFTELRNKLPADLKKDIY